jgi:hypothetical protein
VYYRAVALGVGVVTLVSYQPAFPTQANTKCCRKRGPFALLAALFASQSMLRTDRGCYDADTRTDSARVIVGFKPAAGSVQHLSWLRQQQNQVMSS